MLPRALPPSANNLSPAPARRKIAKIPPDAPASPGSLPRRHLQHRIHRLDSPALFGRRRPN